MNTHPLLESQASEVHASPSSQVTGVPSQHVLPGHPLPESVQTSPVVQAFPSSQAAPTFGVFTQDPVGGSQPSMVHTFPSSQSFGSFWQPVA